MANRSFMDEQRRRQAQQVAALRAKQNGGFTEPASAPETAETAEETPRSKWVNFWYYNKYKVMALVFAAITLAVCVSQCATRETYDYTVVLLADYDFLDNQIEDIETSLAQFGEDLDGNGKVNVQVINCAFGNGVYADIIEAKRSKLAATIAADQTAVLFVTDAENYNYLGSLYDEFFEDLSLPENDGKSVLLPENFYKKAGDGKIPSGLFVSRRRAAGDVLISKKKGVKEAVAAADKFLKKVCETAHVEL